MVLGDSSKGQINPNSLFRPKIQSHLVRSGPGLESDSDASENSLLEQEINEVRKSPKSEVWPRSGTGQRRDVMGNNPRFLTGMSRDSGTDSNMKHANERPETGTGTRLGHTQPK